MSVKLLTEYHLECLRLKEAAQARLSLHMSNSTLLEITFCGSYVTRNIFKKNIRRSERKHVAISNMRNKTQTTHI